MPLPVLVRRYLAITARIVTALVLMIVGGIGCGAGGGLSRDDAPDGNPSPGGPRSPLPSASPHEDDAPLLLEDPSPAESSSASNRKRADNSRC